MKQEQGQEVRIWFGPALFRREVKMSSGDTRVCVSTSVKDSFFDDPFFSDWWKDFDAPMQQTYDKAFQRQISGKSVVPQHSTTS